MFFPTYQDDPSDEFVSRVRVRPLTERDSLEALANLLQRAHKPLRDVETRCSASRQDVEKTRERAIGPGKTTLVAELEAKPIGLVTLWQPEPDTACAYCRRRGLLAFGQLAVEPGLQGLGVGTKLLTRVELLAKASGAAELVSLASEHATGLIAFYRRRGYVEVDRCCWDEAEWCGSCTGSVFSKRLL